MLGFSPGSVTSSTITPADAYTARAKATPDHNREGRFRIRDDKVHARGTVTLRRAGRMHHIGLGRAIDLP